MIGQGKYDHLCTMVREQAKAEAAFVVVVKGNLGSGFSVQAPEHILYSLPDTLRTMADQIEKDMRRGQL